MRLPRDISGIELTKRLSVFGYCVKYQTGSHIKLTTLSNGEHHLVVPNHDCIRVGTLSKILSMVGSHFEINREEVVRRLFK